MADNTPQQRISDSESSFGFNLNRFLIKLLPAIILIFWYSTTGLPLHDLVQWLLVIGVSWILWWDMVQSAGWKLLLLSVVLWIPFSMIPAVHTTLQHSVDFLTRPHLRGVYESVFFSVWNGLKSCVFYFL